MSAIVEALKDNSARLSIGEGTQIIYVPDHADGDIHHPDAEEGFVTSVSPVVKHAFCRYWSRHAPGELRTKSCSELTPVANLVVRDTRPQAEVEAALRQYCS